MRNTTCRMLASTVLAALLALLVVPAAAQPGSRGWGPGMMMGPGMMGGMMGGGMCNPSAAGLAEWRVEAIEQDGPADRHPARRSRRAQNCFDESGGNNCVCLPARSSHNADRSS